MCLKVHNRTAGRLILLCGATGKVIGRYLEVPDSKELYMSPVLHKQVDGSMYVLFGSGGETVPGIDTYILYFCAKMMDSFLCLTTSYKVAK